MDLRPHCDFPTFRDAPRDILAALRDVDPTADLYYLGDGKWVVGRVRPTVERYRGGALLYEQALRAAAHGEIRSEEQWYRRLRSARLTMQGFARVAMYEYPGDPDWRLVREFREAVWWANNDRHDDEINRRADLADHQQRRDARASLMDDAKAREAARLMRRPVSVQITTPMPRSAAS